jgi:TonB family protein
MLIQKDVKVVEADFTLLNQPSAERSTPEAGKKAIVRMSRPARSGGRARAAAKQIATPGGSGKENLEAVPPKEHVEPPREQTMVTASDVMGDTIVHGVPATYADATGAAGSLQSHGGFPGNGRGDGRGEGSGSGRGSGHGAGGGEGELAEGSKDYNYIRDAVMKNISYPEEALRLGVEGKVLLSFIVLENGKTGRIEVVSSSGSRILDQSAKEAVAVTRMGRTVPYRVTVRLPVTYRLNKPKG